MNDEDYLEMLIVLATALERAAKARPYDPVVYNKVVDDFNTIVNRKEQRRRRRPWAAFFCCISLLIILVWIIYEVLCVLYSGGTQ